MKSLFYIGLLLLLGFELANVYFIMPMPGSQTINSLDFAYFFYTWRWLFRAMAGIFLVVGARKAWAGNRWIMGISTTLVVFVTGAINLKMSAEKMFLQPTQLVLADSTQHAIAPDKLIVGIEYKGEARAYPIQLIAYHHQVIDTIAGKAFMITYCSVCRTGRVFEPLVEGKQEEFRLVGMDHFNAMFEDKSTGSWWRQATGEAVTGVLKGNSLPEWPCVQTSLKTWMKLHPNSLIMQPDPAFAAQYASLEGFESGKSKGKLTGTDTASWAEKSWVVGVAANGKTKAYDWNDLKNERIIHDEIGEMPVLLVLASDYQSFFVFERTHLADRYELVNDTLFASGNRHFDLKGNALDGGVALKPVLAYQEFWHSWRTFHPETEKYLGAERHLTVKATNF